jgi:hypothetical protein
MSVDCSRARAHTHTHTHTQCVHCDKILYLNPASLQNRGEGARAALDRADTLDRADIGGSGDLDFVKWRRAFGGENGVKADLLRALFEDLDTDNSGTVSLAEFKAAVLPDAPGKELAVLGHGDGEAASARHCPRPGVQDAGGAVARSHSKLQRLGLLKVDVGESLCVEDAEGEQKGEGGASDPLIHHPQRQHSVTFQEENEEEEGHAQVAAQLVKLPEGLRALAGELQKMTVQKTRLSVVPGWLGELTRLEDPSPAKTVSVEIRAGDPNTKQDIPAPRSKQQAPSRAYPAAQSQPLKKVSTGSWLARADGLGPRLAARGPSFY